MAERRNILGVLERMSSNAVTVRPQRCAIVRNRNVTCSKCAEACTSDCIHFENGTIAVDASKCVGCGTCATVCPTCALETHNPSDQQLLADCTERIVGGSVTIACQQMAQALDGKIDRSKLAEVVCLGRVEESLTSGLAAAGAQNIILLCGDCDQCRQKLGRATAELVVKTSNELLRAWGSEASVSLTESAPGYLVGQDVTAQDLAEAADEFFSVEKGATPIFAAEDVPAEDEEPVYDRPLRVMRDGTLPHFVPDRRERLLDNLATFGQPGNVEVDTRLWGYVVINGMKCSSCRMCATFCPTGAIRKFDNPEDGTMGVDHQPIDCVKCGSCRDICPEGAIVLIDDVKANFLMEGEVHHYLMKPREVELGNAQQIYNTMKKYIGGQFYER